MVKKTTLCSGLMAWMLLLAGCEHIEPGHSCEPDQSPGLFSGKKGYFEIMPNGPESQKDFEEASGLLEVPRL